jgi:hypothetical protein
MVDIRTCKDAYMVIRMAKHEFIIRSMSLESVNCWSSWKSVEVGRYDKTRGQSSSEARVAKKVCIKMRNTSYYASHMLTQ